MDGVTTIITCMTDGERPYVAAALRSVRHQTLPGKVILCVTDTNDWIRELPESLLAGVDLFRLPLQPSGFVRNDAIDRVETDLVAFLDSDDLWRPRKVERQVALLQRYNLDVVAGKHVLVREDGTPFFYAFARSYPMPSTWLGRTAIFRERRFEPMPLAEDAVMWDWLLAAKRCAVLDDFVLHYRVRGGSSSQPSWSMRRKLAYERRSHIPGMRPVLLGVSYAVNIGLRVRDLTGTKPSAPMLRPV
jgi:glycosyltransferase involved in cell wall biosynthesis